MTVKAINLAEKLSLFSEHWSPKIVTTYNDNDIMVVKFEGEFPMHKHPETDDFFLIIEGHVTIETENGNVELKAGELYVVPKGVMHRPIAHGEAKVLLIEPKGTPNSGDPETAAVKTRI